MEPERTDQEIDDAIREWRIRLRDMPEALGVPRERIFDRWEWFRQEVYNRIAEGKSTFEIVEEVGLPARAVAAFRATSRTFSIESVRPDFSDVTLEFGAGDNVRCKMV
jgi:hypothetical protein